MHYTRRPPTAPDTHAVSLRQYCYYGRYWIVIIDYGMAVSMPMDFDGFGAAYTEPYMSSERHVWGAADIHLWTDTLSNALTIHVQWVIRHLQRHSIIKRIPMW